MQQQRLDVQQEAPLSEAPLSLWIAGGVAALAYITALYFSPFWTVALTCDLAASIAIVQGLRIGR